MTRIAFLGLGAMGSRMAARLIDAGHHVTLWNRTPERADALAGLGASVAQSPRTAARKAQIVISMLRDDAASENVWSNPETGALRGMQKGALGIECSTLSPEHIRALHTHAREAKLAFLDAPLAGSRPQAEAGHLIFMAGGETAHVARAKPVLLAMGGAVHHAGGAGDGALVKLMVNALFASQLATLAELLGLAGHGGVDPSRALDIIAATPVMSPAANAAGNAMLAGSFAPAFPIDLVCKDMSLTEGTARALELELPMTHASAETFDRASVAGLGRANITAVAKLYSDPVSKRGNSAPSGRI